LNLIQQKTGLKFKIDSIMDTIYSNVHTNLPSLVYFIHENIHPLIQALQDLQNNQSQMVTSFPGSSTAFHWGEVWKFSLECSLLAHATYTYHVCFHWSF